MRNFLNLSDGLSVSQFAEKKLPKVESTFRKTDVFLKPFEPGICIDDTLTATHTLLFNKFPVRKNHVLIVTT